jgi:hypothetical protein
VSFCFVKAELNREDAKGAKEEEERDCTISGGNGYLK